MSHDRGRKFKIASASGPTHPIAPLPQHRLVIPPSEVPAQAVAPTRISSRTFKIVLPSDAPLISPIPSTRVFSLTPTVTNLNNLRSLFLPPIPRSAPPHPRSQSTTSPQQPLRVPGTLTARPAAPRSALPDVDLAADVIPDEEPMSENREDSSLQLYWDLCCHRDGLIRLDDHTFIIQGWDERSTSLKVYFYSFVHTSHSSNP